MHAGYGAIRRTGFFGEIFAADVVDGVIGERSPGISALLRTVMHQAVFANVQVTRAGAAAPIVGTSFGNVVLEAVDTGEAALAHALHFFIDTFLFVIERLELAAAIVNDADGRGKSKLHSAFADGERILRKTHPAAHHGIDVDVKIGVFGQQLQLLIQYFQ